MGRGRPQLYPRVEHTCKHCCATFLMDHSPSTLAKRTGDYCSRKCNMDAHNTPERSAAVSRATAQQRGETLRNKNPAKPTTYKKLNGRHEHRIVAEQMFGRPLEPGEIVHHEDENKHNNDPSNLIVHKSQSDHAYEHGIERYKRGDLEPLFEAARRRAAAQKGGV